MRETPISARAETVSSSRDAGAPARWNPPTMSRTLSSPQTSRAYATVLQIPECEQPVTMTTPSSPTYASALSSERGSGTSPMGPFFVLFLDWSAPSNANCRGISPRKTRSEKSQAGSFESWRSKCSRHFSSETSVPASGRSSVFFVRNTSGWATSVGRVHGLFPVRASVIAMM